MEDFVELGIEGVDKVIDNHFHKLPDEALHIGTYHPKNLSKTHRRRRRRNTTGVAAVSPTSATSSVESDTETLEEKTRSPLSASSRKSKTKIQYRDMAQSQQNTQSPRQGNVYPEPPYAVSPVAPQPPYSREPPKIRSEYMPTTMTPPPIGVVGGYYPPPPSFDDGSRRGRGRRDRDYDDDYYSDSYRAPPRRPKAVTRRSSSYHGPRDRDYYSSDSEDDNKQIVKRSGGGGSSKSQRTKKEEEHHDGIRGRIEENFTKSPAGVTGGVLGALAGGWVAKKAQESKGRDGKSSNPALTALGAVVGGLAVNAVIDKVQHRNKEVAKKQEKWDEKWGNEDESDDSGRRSYDNGRGRGERDGRGYQPYN